MESSSELNIFEIRPFDPLYPGPWAKRIRACAKSHDHQQKRACEKIK